MPGGEVKLHALIVAMADPSNQEIIRRYCRRYPGLRLILAHAGRGFNPHHTIEGQLVVDGKANSVAAIAYRNICN